MTSYLFCLYIFLASVLQSARYCTAAFTHNLHFFYYLYTYLFFHLSLDHLFSFHAYSFIGGGRRALLGVISPGGV